MTVAPAILSRIPPARRCPMMKMWAAFASSVPGLCGVRLVGVGRVTCFCLVGAASDRLLHQEKDMSVEYDFALSAHGRCRWLESTETRCRDDDACVDDDPEELG